MKIKAIATMIVTVVAGSGFLANNALAGTTSATLTVDSIVTMGTCTSTLLDTNDTQISTVAFGDVYISELVNKSKKKAFKIRFSDCAGIPGKKAKVKLSPRTPGCATNNAAFANKSSNGPATNAAVEVWTTITPGENESVQFNCSTVNTQTVDLSTVTVTRPYDYNLSAQMIIANGGTVSSVTPGDFLSPATFTITYQ
ncbi:MULTISPECIES: fimbrial protein [Escherichia]|uniref:fimbrial protein n=1 Tax=Escherichia TaxID=561 RepID=UPI0006147EE4|nr:MULTISPECIES: fimbrial protein [Escherichia]AXM03726.1 fimbrial protein [Escherichia fergusonii]EFF0769470.1 fimbrial protein [Escherichia fergusonii]EFL4493789.1 fimbrial protein [Escherichia fergusonii]EHG5980536.1 fimbrial protein [Escherichia fergusonii]EHG5991435.1 fimbrial protein [Escherichia fergusonii]